MEPGRWGLITDIYHATIARSPEERASFLGDECHGDASLRKQVEAMVRSHERSGDFIESPAFAVAPELLIDQTTGDLIGQLIGHYRIESLLGVGGMGEVYLARDEQLGRKVALKFLPERLTADETQLSRFKTEARAASALNHPNILTVYEIGAEEDRRFIATEFIEGITLRALLGRGPMNLHDALEIAVQVASALAAAHETGVVHRDIKPENIMLRPDGYAKVLDFGIAKLTEQQPESDSHDLGTTTLQTQPGLLLGTAHYMSPEQTRGQMVDVRSDIWSLGVVIYEMVRGIQPFTGDTPSDCIASILTTEPQPLSDALPDAPVKVQAIVQKALRKNSHERYQTINEMLADLRNLKGDLAGSPPRRAGPILSKIKRHKRATLLALATAMLAAAAFAYHFYFPAPAPLPNEKSIAVLPFTDLSQARDQEYFCDGISEEILDSLARTEGLRVVARTSSFSFKGRTMDVGAIAQKLGVRTILEGSVRRDGNRVRITAQLVSAANGSHLWSETYERELQGVFAVQDEITRAIVDALKVKLALSLPAREQHNTEAYDLYLQGLYFSNKSREADLRKALSFFQRALDKDPTFARAWTGIAKVWFWLCDAYVKPLDAWPAVKEAALKAIALDDRDAEAYAYVAEANRLLDWDFAGADAELRRALQLDPNFAFGHLMLLHFNALQGQLEEALRQGMEGKKLDPLSPAISTVVSGFYLDTGRLDEALAEAERTQMLDPDYLYPSFAYGPAVAYREKGMFDKAIALYSKAQETTQLPSSGLAITYVRMGRQVEARHILNQLIEKARTRYIAADSIAAVYVALGEKDEAFRWLERAYAEHSWGVPNIAVSHEFRPLRSDPRYADLLRRTGLDPAKAPGRRLVEKVLGTAENKSPAHSVESKSIAVLPFANLSSEPDTAYFADGIQEEILTRLAKVADLKVISHMSTQRYKNASANLSEIAKQLGVANLLEGSVQKAGNQVRVNVQLIRAQDASHLWAETYDRNLNDIFAVESQIATKIADTLKATLTGSEQQALATRSTENPEAHQLYLYGRYFWNKRTGPDLQKAIGYFKRAIEKDPTYALAHAGLADAYVLLPGFGGASPQESLPLAKAAAQKALELDDTLAEAHSSLGLVLICYDFDLAGSMKEFERAIQLNPNYATAHQWFGNQTLILCGDFDRAIAESKRAVELDPLSLIINAGLGIDYFAARRYDEAIEQLHKTIEIDPRFYYAHWILGEALEMKGQLPEALKEYRKAAELDDDTAMLGFIAEVSAKMGRRDEALKILAQLQQLASQRYVSDYTFALVHLALGENEKAIAWLERAYEHRAGPDIMFIKLDPMLNPLRGDPQFERLVAKVFGSAENKSPAQPIESKSIAVLPFENLSSEPDTAYFADGIQEEILTRLAKIADLKVISRTSTRHYKSAPHNLPEIAKRLGVAHIVEGTIQKSADQVRVNVQLINAQNDSHLWANKYDRKLTDIFSVESEIAEKIADSLQAKLSGNEQHAIAARPTKSTVAYQLYLKGTYFSNKRTGADLRTATEYFKAAIGKDPKYAAAYAGLADAYTLRSLWGGEGPADTMPQAKAAARKAIELDETLPEAHNSLGLVLALHDFDFAQSAKEFERAIELNPNYATAHHQFGNVNLSMIGEFDRAIAEGIRAVELDPLSLIINADLGQNFMLARRYDEAINQLRKTLVMDPRFYYARWTLGECLEMKGQLTEAMAEYQKAAEITDDPMVTALLAQGYAKTGQRDKALGLLAQLEQLAAQRYVGPFAFALVHQALGESEKAIDELERAYRERGDPGIVGIKVEPLLDPLRGHPRFERLLGEVVRNAQNESRTH